MEHDTRFKQLFDTFFLEFVELFLPQVAAYLDQEFGFVPLDKEVFADLTSGETHEADLVVQARFKGEEAFFLLHVENQATRQTEFPRRMYRYFSRLHDKYALPVYPIAIFSYREPKRPEPDFYEVGFPDKTVLRFEYVVIQLNRLSWRDFLSQPNPVACALMTKMDIAPADRPRVRLECLRLLATLKLAPAKSRLIGAFIEAYLQLNAEELKQYQREFDQLSRQEQEANMELINSWEEKGRAEGLAIGRTEGKEESALLIITERFGKPSRALEAQVQNLSETQLNELIRASLKFTGVADLENWLKRQTPQ